MAQGNSELCIVQLGWNKAFSPSYDRILKVSADSQRILAVEPHSRNHLCTARSHSRAKWNSQCSIGNSRNLHPDRGDSCDSGIPGFASKITCKVATCTPDGVTLATLEFPALPVKSRAKSQPVSRTG